MNQSPNPQSTPVEDGVYAALGLVVVTAVYADGRAHILGLPDSFFSPWHAFLYGGLALMVGWLGVMSRLAGLRSEGRRFAIIPAGYRAAAAGAAIFAIGGLADMLWHVTFGIEFGIDALLSPSHLLLFLGGGLLLSGPLLAAHRRQGATVPTRVPALAAVISITAIAGFALSLLSAFLSDAPTMTLSYEPEGTRAHEVSDTLASAGLGSFVVTTLLLVAPAVYLIRTRIWFPGALAALITVIAAYASSLTGFQLIESIAAAFVAGAVLDLIVLALQRRTSGRTSELAVAAGLPLLLWTGQLAAIGARHGLGWSEEMTSGTVLLSALVSFTIILVVGHGPAAVSSDDRARASSDKVGVDGI